MNMRTKFTWGAEVASITLMSNTKEPLWLWFTAQGSFWKDLLMGRPKWLWYRIMTPEEISPILSKDGWQVKVSTFWKMLKKRSRKSIKKLDISNQNYFPLLCIFMINIFNWQKTDNSFCFFDIFDIKSITDNFYCLKTQNMILKFLLLSFRTKI